MGNTEKQGGGLWSKLLFGLVGLLLLLAAAASYGSTLLWPPINDVTTGATDEYPKLTAQVFSASPTETHAAVLKAIGAIDRMRVVSEDEDKGLIEVESDTPRGTFTDDVTIHVEHGGDGGSRVVIRSRSRVGELDFGQNARNIKEIQAALEKELER